MLCLRNCIVNVELLSQKFSLFETVRGRGYQVTHIYMPKLISIVVLVKTALMQEESSNITDSHLFITVQHKTCLYYTKHTQVLVLNINYIFITDLMLIFFITL